MEKDKDSNNIVVLIIGASGFIGRKLALQLARDGKIVAGGEGDDKMISKLILADQNPPEPPLTATKTTTIPTIETVALDISDATSIQKVLQDSSRPNIIFHLAAIVSGDAERNFELGYQVNVDGTRLLLDTIKNMGSDNDYKPPPRLVFSSSLAVYGPPIPDIIPDNHATTPRGSYGTQKAVAELLLEDYTRKGYVDGISIRFPTIAIRPGQPNKAASSFVSGIIREPLAGQPAPLPVNLDFRHTVASPQAAVDYLLRAATLQPEKPGDRTLQMPGISLLVKEMIESLERVAGQEVTQLIQHQPDPFIIGIVENWPKQFESQRALQLGFRPDASYDDIIRAYMRDEGISVILPDTNKESGGGGGGGGVAATKKGTAALGLRGFSHISVNVPVIEDALQFYSEVLGFEKMKGGKQWGDFDFRGLDTEAFAKNAGFMSGHCKVDCVWMYHPLLQLNLELMHFYVEGAENQIDNLPKTQDIGGVKHLSLIVDDINVAFAYLKKQPGVRFVTDDPAYKPHQLEPFPFKFFYFIDPFGVQWELEEYGDKVVTNRIPSVTREMDAFIEYK